MAMIKCDECGREISSKSLFCPNCGHPTHLNSGHPDGIEPEAFTQLKAAVTAVKPEKTAPAEPQPAPEEAVEASVQAPEVAETAPVEETPEVPAIPAEETPAEVEASLDSAIDDYEATLEGGRDRRRHNERAKVAIFLGVFLALLGVVLYFYFTSPVEAVNEEIAEEEVTSAEADTAAQTVAPLDQPAETGEYTTDTVTSRAIAPASGTPAARPVTATSPAPAAAAEEPREIRVAPLSEQVSHPDPE